MKSISSLCNEGLKEDEYDTKQPKGRYVIGVCKGTACYVKGTERILNKLQNILDIEAGSTTKDGMFSLEVVRCLGACGLGPVMSINEDVYTRAKPEKVQEIINSYYSRQEKIVSRR